MTTNRSSFHAILAIALAAPVLFLPARESSAAEGEVRVPVTADNSIVLVEGEYHLNAGAEPRIRIKGNQHLVALAFDTAPLRGRLVRSATLVCRRVDHTIDGVTLSTISADWDEMKSNALTSGVRREEGWAWPGALFPAVTGGNGFSLVSQARSTIKDDAYHWEVAPDLVHASAIGAAHGLAIHEWVVDYSRNPRIYSREERGKEPYLLVEFGGTEPKPDPPTDLRVADNGDADGMRLHLRGPRNGFAYEVTVGGKALPRWNIPFVAPGEEQVIPIRDLGVEPGARVAISVATLSRVGEKSRPATVTATVPNPKAPPMPNVPGVSAAKPALEDLCVIPVLDKYDAAGKPVGDLSADYRTRNGAFDGGTIRLVAARGEVVGFQALLKGKGEVKLACELPGIRTEMRRALYVASEGGRRIPDPLVTFETLALSETEVTPVAVDVFVPFDFARDRVAGSLKVSDGRTVPIALTVRRFAIPREASFLCEMNSYGLPDKVSEFYRLQEIAYDHRVHANILYYSHRTAAPGARKCNLDMVMPNGRRMDEKRYNAIEPGATRGYWDDFVAVFGPYLSGSYFKNGHRGPVPAPGFYLTFHESWPLNVRAYFNGNPDAYEAFNARPEYAETFVNILKDFLRVAQREGWTRTGFQIYLNNKGSLNEREKNPWILDEPTAYWDYRALAYYADLVKRARGPEPHATVRYRIDISRPEFDRGQLEGKADLWVVSTDALRRYVRLVADRAERTGERIWMYGSTSRVEEPNRGTARWVLEAYRAGASGVVPWQTINKDGSALQRADTLGLFIFEDRGGGPAAIHHSMRLKAYREAEQMIEYLELVRRGLGLTPGQMRAFVDHYVGGDQGTSAEAWRALREGAAELIESRQAAPGR
jgi:hypothetical protein